MTVDPTRPDRATSLVSTGVYRFTRNPMYLGFATILMGWGVQSQSVTHPAPAWGRFGMGALAG